MTYITNAFPINALQKLDFSRLTVSKIGLDAARALASETQLVSAIGHQSTADVVSNLIGVQIPMRRERLIFNPGDDVLVFSLNTRLEEGKVLTKDELEKLDFQFYFVTINE